MKGRYTLEWLDSLITVSLNPEKSDISSMTDAQIRSLNSRIGKERDKQQAIIKEYIFGSNNEEQVELLLKHYHSSLVILLDQALENHKYVPVQRPRLKQLTHDLIQCLEELLYFIEVRFSCYLSLDERVSETYLQAVKNEFKQRVKSLKSKLIRNSENCLGEIVLESLNVSDNTAKDFPITFQEVSYKKDLLRELEALKVDDQGAFPEKDLNALLIYMGFNSKSYVNYLSQRISENISCCNTLSGKMDKILVHFKEFNQMRRKPGVILNPQFMNLKTELSNWFKQEISYLEKKIQLSFVQEKIKNETIHEDDMQSHKTPQKLLCNLSVDQLALILKSADDLRIIISRSLTMVFKTIVPHLSTPHQENISYDSMRSKSYSIEERDKEIVIQTLEKMIDKISEY